MIFFGCSPSTISELIHLLLLLRNDQNTVFLLLPHTTTPKRSLSTYCTAVLNKIVCLEPESTYKWVLKNYIGDGLCGDHRCGYALVEVDGEEIVCMDGTDFTHELSVRHLRHPVRPGRPGAHRDR